MSLLTNSFFIFCEEYRDIVKDNNPDRPNSEISSILGQLWRNLPSNEKLKYSNLALSNREVRANKYLNTVLLKHLTETIQN